MEVWISSSTYGPGSPSQKINKKDSLRNLHSLFVNYNLKARLILVTAAAFVEQWRRWLDTVSRNLEFDCELRGRRDGETDTRDRCISWATSIGLCGARTTLSGHHTGRCTTILVCGWGWAIRLQSFAELMVRMEKTQQGQLSLRNQAFGAGWYYMCSWKIAHTT